jgi:hypothetical protein
MSQTSLNRLKPIELLAQNEPAFIYNAAELLAAEERAEYITNTYAVLPTIGCEIEVTSSALLPDFALKYFGNKDQYGKYDSTLAHLSGDERREMNKEWAAANAALLPRFEATKTAGIPQGKDAYWEFAQSPAYCHGTLTTEASLLMHKGLIPVGHEHSLHITIGCLAAHGGTGLLLAGIELIGSSAERIRLGAEPAMQGSSAAWARRKSDGIRERPASTIQLGASIATEFRTLIAKNPSQLAITLKTAQMLAAPLIATRMQIGSQENQLISPLANIWPPYKTAIKRLLVERGLPASDTWGHPTKNVAAWLTWAECLEKVHDTSTIEFETVQTLRACVQHIENIIA